MFSNKTLKDYDVKNQSTIIVKLRLSGGCFPGYAPITLMDGTTKIISEININDELVSYDDKLNKFAINKVINIKVGKAKDFIII